MPGLSVHDVRRYSDDDSLRPLSLMHPVAKPTIDGVQGRYILASCLSSAGQFLVMEHVWQKY